MTSVLYVVGYCPSCETGPLGVRVCGACGGACVLCDECDALWASPDLSNGPRFPAQPDLPCPSCGAALVRGPAHWASYQELEVAGWQRKVLDVGRPFGDTCSADEDH